jgi:predicted ATP-dependent endonuclease of OLD family
MKNFRSIGDTGLELTFPTLSTIFIGENNVGKSSIFEAIKMMINLDVQSTIPWDSENWYGSDRERMIELSLLINLNGEDISTIKRFFDPLQISNEEFLKFFSDQLIYRIVINTPNNRPESFLTLGKFSIKNSVGRVGDLNEILPLYNVRWSDLVESGISETFEKSIKKYFFNLWEAQHQPSAEFSANKLNISQIEIAFPQNMPKLFLGLLKEKIISIEEYRERPKKELNPSLVSSTGVSLASILFNLKNGRPKEKAKFEEIKQEFHEIFSNLELDVIKEGEEIKIHTQKNNIESTTLFLGAGILQTLLLITHIVAHKEKIILVDHPELYLHPHAQRNLANLIDDSDDIQIFLITHSPYFVNLDQCHKIIRFVQKNSQTEVHTMLPEYFTEMDYLKLEQLLDIDSKELFFARKVLLVEGPTEYGAIPVFAKAQKYSFDKNGVSIVDVGGKSNLDIFARLCEGYHIPYLILADGDAKKMLEKIDIPNKSKKFRFNILSENFEAILPGNLMKEAEKKVGKSKPRVGKYVANEMIKRKIDTPSEILKLIVKLKELQV